MTTATAASQTIARHIGHLRPADENAARGLYREIELSAEPTSPLGKAFATMRQAEDELTISGFARIQLRMFRAAVNKTA